MKLSNPWMKLFIQSDNQTFKVRHIALNVADANAFCAKNEGTSVIGETEDGLVIVANDKAEAR